MNVSASGGMQQMIQTQTRKMDGSGGGQGGGMKDVMQQLPEADRNAIKEQMQSLSPSDKVAAKDQINQIDSSTMTLDDYTQSIMNILNPTDITSTDAVEVYA